MKLSQAIYRLSKLARVLDIDGCEDDVNALNIAVDVLSMKLKDEQAELAIKHVCRPEKRHRGNNPKLGLTDQIKANL